MKTFVFCLFAFLVLIGCKKRIINNVELNTKSDSLFLLSHAVPLKKNPLVIQATGNFQGHQKPFELISPCNVKVCYSGEMLILKSKAPYNFDGIELYFDCENEKLVGFNSLKDDKQFILNQKSTIKGIEFVQTQTSPTKYTLEAHIPWRTLKTIPSIGKVLGFDFSVNDNDGKMREKVKTWHSEDTDMYINTSLYGNLVLGNKDAKYIDTSKNAVARYSVITPKIDGKKEKVWQNAYTYYPKHLVLGKVLNDNDISASLKLLWNKSGLSIFGEVEDNIICLYSNVFFPCDYGWIEDDKSNKVFEVVPTTTHHAGGALKNRNLDTLIHLKAGKYILKYITDESHSPNQWDDAPPSSKFYGIKISYVIKQ